MSVWRCQGQCELQEHWACPVSKMYRGVRSNAAIESGGVRGESGGVRGEG